MELHRTCIYCTTRNIQLSSEVLESKSVELLLGGSRKYKALEQMMFEGLFFFFNRKLGRQRLLMLPDENEYYMINL